MTPPTANLNNRNLQYLLQLEIKNASSRVLFQSGLHLSTENNYLICLLDKQRIPSIPIHLKDLLLYISAVSMQKIPTVQNKASLLKEEVSVAEVSQAEL